MQQLGRHQDLLSFFQHLHGIVTWLYPNSAEVLCHFHHLTSPLICKVGGDLGRNNRERLLILIHAADALKLK
jgi:hypothetical protein